MVTGKQQQEPSHPAGITDVGIEIHGERPVSAELVEALGALCDRAEDLPRRAVVVIHLTGAPERAAPGDLAIGLTSKWERTVRRLERLPVPTIAVASGDCGGPALDALLAADYRIAARSLRLLVPVYEGATWPGMALYRLAQQAGTAGARRSALFGAPIGAAEALNLHLIDELTDDPAAALAAAIALAGGFPGAELALRRQLIQEASVVTFEDALGAHLAACDRALRQMPTDRRG